MSGFKGLLASKNPDIKCPLEVYLMSDTYPFGGRIGNLVSNANKDLKLYLSVASVGTSGIPVVSGDALAPESLYLDGDWSVAGDNKRVLVYPAGTQLDISRFTHIASSLNPALVTISDGSVVLMVNCNMSKLTIAAESPAPVTYDGAEHGLAVCPTVSPSDVGATLAYLAADGETWTEFDELEDLPTFTEAGDHEIQLRAVADGYQTAFETVSVRINKVTGSWTDEPSIAPTEWTEGERDSLYVFFGTPSLGSDPVDRYAIEGGVKFYAVETLTEHLLGLSAGPYTVMFTAESENPNYEALTKEIPITVIANVPDTPIARPTANNYTYNATERAGVADGEGYTVVNGKKTAVGDYTATVTLATGYCWDSEPAKETLHLPWSIARAAATVTADDKSKKIGETDPELTATVTGLFGADTVAYTLSRVAGEDVGTYAITPSGSAVQGNYDVSFVTGTFTITDTPTITPVTVNGGYHYEDGDDTVFVFTSTEAGQTFQVGAACKADLLVVGGGAGGTAGAVGAIGGGGGGGEVASADGYPLAAGTYAVTVGAGGAGSTAYSGLPRAGANGGQSSFGALLTANGGKGHSDDSGTGNYHNGGNSGTYNGGLGAEGGTSTAGLDAGGGAGAGGNGYNDNDASYPGWGAEGVTSRITGTDQVYGSGGGGAVSFVSFAEDPNRGKGGTNAGHGKYTSGKDPTWVYDATPGFGGGGGGGGKSNSSAAIYSSGAGGSGTVIIRVKGQCDVTGGNALKPAEYVQNTRNANRRKGTVIDLDYKPNQNTQVIADYYVSSIGWNGCDNQTLFDASDSNSHRYGLREIWNSGNSKWNLMVGSGETSSGNKTAGVGRWTVSMNSSSVSLTKEDGSTTTISRAALSAQVNECLRLFGDNSAGTVDWIASNMRIYSFRIYEGSTGAVRNLIPCELTAPTTTSDGTVHNAGEKVLYDTITEAIYGFKTFN